MAASFNSRHRHQAPTARARVECLTTRTTLGDDPQLVSVMSRSRRLDLVALEGHRGPRTHSDRRPCRSRLSRRGRIHPLRAFKDQPRVIAPWNIHDPETLDIEPPNHRVIDPKQPRARRARPPGRLDRSALLLGRLDRRVRELTRITSIERPARGRIVIADDGARVAGVVREKPVESLRLSPSHDDRGEGQDRVWRLEMDVDEIEGPLEFFPVFWLQDDATRIAIIEGDAVVDGGVAERDAHTAEVVAGFEATEGEFARDGFGRIVAEFLDGEDVDLIFADEVDEAFWVGPSPIKISGQHANRPGQARPSPFLRM